MSTRSLIAIELPNGKVKSIYVHSDGYVEGNGKLLVNHYATYDKAIKLFDYGDCSYLGETTNECSFYKRDWGRDGYGDTATYNNEFCIHKLTQERPYTHHDALGVSRILLFHGHDGHAV